MKQEIILPIEGRSASVERLGRVLIALPPARYRVTVEEAKRTRTDPQNRFLWATYGDILKMGGNEMAGWTVNDLHDFFLMDHFGAETYEVFGKKRVRAIRRSSKLNKQEFSDYIAHIQQFMAERGVFLPDYENG